jgi:hypothetical protein
VTMISLLSLNHADDEMEEEDTNMVDDNAAPDLNIPASTRIPAFVTPLLSLIHPTPLSFPPLAGGSSPHPPTTSVLASIHVCALECLNNVFLSLATSAQNHQQAVPSEVDPSTGVTIWTQVWAALEAVGTDVNGPGQERRREMWEVAVGILWGVAVVWKGILVSDVWLLIVPQLLSNTSYVTGARTQPG